MVKANCWDVICASARLVLTSGINGKHKLFPFSSQPLNVKLFPSEQVRRSYNHPTNALIVISIFCDLTCVMHARLDLIIQVVLLLLFSVNINKFMVFCQEIHLSMGYYDKCVFKKS